MWLPIFGLIFGVLFGSVFTVTVPVIYAKYLSVAVLAALDSLLGSFRAILEGSFDETILLTGFFTNALLAAILAYLGDHLGLDIYLAAVVAFGIRLFSNLGFIRRYLITRYWQKKAVEADVKNKVIKEKWPMPLFVAFFIFALLISTQYRTQMAYLGSLSSQKSEDLVSIVKSLNEKRTGLEAEVNDLLKMKRSLDEQSSASISMTESLNNELRQLQALNGSVPVEGPGVVITITGDSNLMHWDLIDIVNELWVSGAEVASINDIRITGNTVISQAKDKRHKLMISINDQPLLTPVVIKAIGNADTLEKGLTFTGGIIDNLNTLYQVYPTIKKVDKITIPRIRK